MERKPNREACAGSGERMHNERKSMLIDTFFLLYDIVCNQFVANTHPLKRLLV
jgi:hypothetical protein